jgi:hypothetical protein
MTMRFRSSRALRRAIALALLACGTTAQAVTVNPDGAGQALIFPYYTVNDGSQTLVSVTNTDDRAKAVKIRFREALNGRTVLEFSLYVDANDTWSGAIFANSATDAANFTTADRSCTVPAIRANGALPQLPGGLRYVPFRNFGYTEPNEDAGPNGVARTREGFLEMIEMGSLRPGSPSAQAAAIGPGGTPTSCATLITAWTPGGYWSQDPTRDLDPPRGGLVGHAMVVDVMDGTLYAARPTALDAFRDAPLHGQPGVESPTLADARSSANGDAVADVLVGGRIVRSTYPAGRGIDAVSATLAAEQLFNDYVLDPGLGARTDWVVTLPTKQFYADAARSGGAAIDPFEQVFPAAGSVDAVCERAALAVLDRDAQGPVRSCAGYASDPGACGLPDTLVCGQVGVLSFATSGSPLSSGLASGLSGIPESAGGVARLDLGNQADATHALRASLEGHVWHGLPAIGFSAAQFVNGRLVGNTLANYSDADPHHASRVCTGCP